MLSYHLHLGFRRNASSDLHLSSFQCSSYLKKKRSSVTFCNTADFYSPWWPLPDCQLNIFAYILRIWRLYPSPETREHVMQRRHGTSLSFWKLFIFDYSNVSKDSRTRHKYINMNKMGAEYPVTYKGLAWLIIMGFRFDDWVYWHFFTITVDYYSSQSIFDRRGLSPFCFSFYDWLQTTFVVPYKPSARTTHRKHNPSNSSIVIEVCLRCSCLLFLPAYSLPRECV
jgi:hypothetical protein